MQGGEEFVIDDLGSRDIDCLLARQGGRAGVQSAGGGQDGVRHDSYDQPTLVQISSHGIRRMEELAREGPFDENDVLGAGSVGIGEGSACKERNLQGIEKARGDIHLVSCYLLSRRLAVTDGDYSINEGTLIGQSQSDGGVLHAGNRAHAGEALSEELSEGGGVVIAGVIERRLGGDHSGWVEPWRHGLKVDERANEQSSGGQQHESEGNLSGDQPLPEANAARTYHGAAADRGPQIDFAGGQRRQHAEEYAGQQREGKRKGQDAAIERHVRNRQKMFRQKQQQAAQGKKAHCYACRSA